MLNQLLRQREPRMHGALVRYEDACRRFYLPFFFAAFLP
jgi:hypothetical protein